MSTMKNLTATLCLTMMSLAGCAADQAGDAPATANDDLDPQQQVSNNGWTADVGNGSGYDYISAYITLSGPGGTTKSGICAINVYQNGAYNALVACNSTADCSSAPTFLPSGGYRYCEAFQGSGTKYCMFRPGAQTTYCKGYTPPGNLTEIGVGTTSTGNLDAKAGGNASYVNRSGQNVTIWTAIGCLNGPCGPGTSNPYSVGSANTVAVP